MTQKRKVSFQTETLHSRGNVANWIKRFADH